MRPLFRRLAPCSLFLGAFLVGCSPRQYSITVADYVSVLSWHENFKILQLTDLHFSSETDVTHELCYLDHVVAAAESPDMIMITGDSLLLSDKKAAEALFARIRSYDIPYAVTWGNHDRLGDYSFDWLTKLVMEGKSLYRQPPCPPEMGDGNYAIDLKSGDALMWRIFALDTHSLTRASLFRYQYLPLNVFQVSMVSSLAEASEKSEGVYAPSLSYFHIPLQEYQKAADNFEGRRTYEKWGHPESISPSDQPSTFFSVFKQYNGKAIFCGHDHANDYTADYDGVTLGYGVKTDRELYFRSSSQSGHDATGGSLVTLHGDETFALTHLYVQDNENYEVIREDYK